MKREEGITFRGLQVLGRSDDLLNTIVPSCDDGSWKF